MTEEGEEKGKGDQGDLQALLAKIEEAERLLGEIREEMCAVVGESGAVAPVEPESAQPAAVAVESPVKTDTSPPSPESHRAPIQGLFRVAISPPQDADELEAALGALLHSSAKIAPRAVKMMIRFPWARFRKSFHQYLTDPAQSDSFVIERKSPDDLSAALKAKVFISVSGKHPAPVELARDDEENSPWEIVSFSL